LPDASTDLFAHRAGQARNGSAYEGFRKFASYQSCPLMLRALLRLSLLLVGLNTLPLPGRGQARTDLTRAKGYFAEWRAAAARDAGRFWGRSLAGPVLLVEPDARWVLANVPDSAGLLRAAGGVYAGTLPTRFNVANTAVRWAGRRWSMLLWPLPADHAERLTLLAHESFHRLQPALGFTIPELSNAHLDQEAGRGYLRLELAALRQALQAATPAQAQARTRAALSFRAARRRRYPAAAAAAENALELNEGLAEYTGLQLSGRSAAQQRQHLLAASQAFERSPSFVRSFAYLTLPLYGYLLRPQAPRWHRQITSSTDLTALFNAAFRVRPTAPAALRALESAYGGRAIREQERAREQRQQRQLAVYRQQFQVAPHLIIPLRKMNVAFDPRTAVPLDTAGTVYPTLRVTDDWGVLTASGGALLGARWNQVTVPAPTDTLAPAAVAGPGYTLQLPTGWRVRRTPDGNFQLRPTASPK